MDLFMKRAIVGNGGKKEKNFDLVGNFDFASEVDLEKGNLTVQNEDDLFPKIPPGRGRSSTTSYHSLKHLPIWTIVSGLALVAVSSLLFREAYIANYNYNTNAKWLSEWTDNSKTNNNNTTNNILALKSKILCNAATIGILVGCLQVSVSIFNLIFRKYGLKNWLIAQVMISVALAVNTSHTGAVGILDGDADAEGETENEHYYYNAPAFFYTSLLDCFISIGTALASVLLCERDPER